MFNGRSKTYPEKRLLNFKKNEQNGETRCLRTPENWEKVIR